MNIDIDVLLNSVLDTVVIPALDGEYVSSVQRFRDFVLQSRIARGRDDGVVEVGLHRRGRCTCIEDLRVDAERTANIRLLLGRMEISGV